MRFSYIEAMTDPDYYGPLAIACEEAGYSGFVIPDSICYPEHSDSKYPYTPDGNREFLEDKPFIEPFSMIPYLAALTETLRFTTSVVKLPLRHPVLMAKQASSVAVLSKNRFCFGVGVSPWPDDYEIVDIPWERRGKRMDECIDIIRGLTSGGFFGYDGEIYKIPSIKISPVSTRKIPIIIGGHSDPALKRAARVGDGWIHAGGDPNELGEMLGRLRTFLREQGREGDPFEVQVISMDGYTPDGVKRLQDLGVTDVIVGFRNAYELGPDRQTLDQKLGTLRQYADSVIAKVSI